MVVKVPGDLPPALPYIMVGVMEQQPALLIDARNAVYSAVYANLADHRNGYKDHPFAILLRQMVSWIHSKRPSSVHVFWDAPRDTVWRRQVLSTYKNRTKSPYVAGLAEGLANTTAVATEFFKLMNVRQYSKKEMEADDLIYAAVASIHPSPSIIASNDSDMVQIPYRFSSCTVYNPKKKIDTPPPDYNPAYFKALVGDEADSIEGYDGVGPVTGAKLLRDRSYLHTFLKMNGTDRYYRNLLLIDLSFCPKVMANTVYVQRRLAEPVVFAKDDINVLIMKHKVPAMMAEFANLVGPFKNLI